MTANGTQPPSSELERRLTHEILISERLRVQILAGIPGLALIAFMAVTASYPDAVDLAFQGETNRLRVGLLLGGFTVYELVALRAVQRLIQSRREPPPLRRYVNALVETSLPTLAILYYMAILPHRVDALLLPPALFYFLFILLSTLRLEVKLCLFTGAVAAVEYAMVAAFAVADPRDWGGAEEIGQIPHHLAKSAVLLVSGIAAAFVARRLRTSFVNTLVSMEERSRVVSVFGQHVSPAVVERLLAEKTANEGELREVCVMFVDVRDFTRFSEKKTPQEVVSYLNALFEPLLAAVNAHHGIVNKFLGDGFMAVFGAPLADPEPCRHAVDAARAMLERVRERVDAGVLPETRIGIGVAAGAAVLGNVGSSTRKEFTVIGDVVNVASRIEALNKELGSQLLVTEQVWEAAGRPESSAVRELRVRGREAPLCLHQLA